MASVYKRKNDGGTACCRAVVRIKGHPPVCNHFDRKQEADGWAADVERQIRLGQYRFDRHSVTNTFSDLADRFLRDGALEHHRSAKDTLRHIAYWKTLDVNESYPMMRSLGCSFPAAKVVHHISIVLSSSP